MHRAIAFAFLPLLAASAVSAGQNTPALDGHTLFTDRGCAHCHGPEAAGSEDAPSLHGIAKRLTPEAIRRQITDGGKSMPAFGDALTPDETDTLIAWLRSLKPLPKPPTRRGAR